MPVNQSSCVLGAPWLRPVRYADLDKDFELWNLSASDREVLAKAKNLCTGVLVADGALEPARNTPGAFWGRPERSRCAL